MTMPTGPAAGGYYYNVCKVFCLRATTSVTPSSVAASPCHLPPCGGKAFSGLGPAPAVFYKNVYQMSTKKRPETIGTSGLQNQSLKHVYQMSTMGHFSTGKATHFSSYPPFFDIKF